MGSNAHRVGRANRSSKPDLWYYDRLPPTARQALANADREWSSAWLFNAWNKGKTGYKTGQQCAVRVKEADRKVGG